jgi:hypothetical protein
VVARSFGGRMLFIDPALQSQFDAVVITGIFIIHEATDHAG